MRSYVPAVSAPPSTTMYVPLMNEASSDARDNLASGVSHPGRRSGELLTAHVGQNQTGAGLGEEPGARPSDSRGRTRDDRDLAVE